MIDGLICAPPSFFNANHRFPWKTEIIRLTLVKVALDLKSLENGTNLYLFVSDFSALRADFFRSHSDLKSVPGSSFSIDRKLVQFLQTGNILRPIP